MSSTFNGVALFNSGPHRFAPGKVGRLLDNPLRGGNVYPYSQDRGTLEPEITQTGRLVAASEGALWALWDAVRDKAEAPTTGTLIDHSGRSWPGMTMVMVQATGPVDRGRVFSLEYTVRYLKFGG